MKRFKKIFLSLPLISILAIIDQLSKSFFIFYLKTQKGMIYDVTSFFSFVYAWNYGVSFGFLSEYYQYSNYGFLALNCLITGYLFSILHSPTTRTQYYGLVFIIGGAIGNIIDRIFRGAVFDFIYFHHNEYSFPAFNIADSFINIGVGLMIISLFRFAK